MPGPELSLTLINQAKLLQKQLAQLKEQTEQAQKELREATAAEILSNQSLLTETEVLIKQNNTEVKAIQSQIAKNEASLIMARTEQGILVEQLAKQQRQDAEALQNYDELKSQNESQKTVAEPQNQESWLSPLWNISALMSSRLAQSPLTSTDLVIGDIETMLNSLYPKIQNLQNENKRLSARLTALQANLLTLVQQKNTLKKTIEQLTHADYTNYRLYELSRIRELNEFDSLSFASESALAPNPFNRS